MKRILVFSLVVSALFTLPVVGQNLIDRFSSGQMLSHGTVVVQQGDEVEPASIDSNSTLLGVVSSSDSSDLFSVSNDGRQLNVVTSGITDILVSTQNGPVKTGDQLTVSQLAGVATVSKGQSILLGTALDDFDGSQSLLSIALTDADRVVEVGRVRVRVDIHRLASGSQLSRGTPRFVQQFADNIAGKPVAPIRAAVSFLIVLGTLILATSLFITLESSAHGSKQRNPSSTLAVNRSKYQLLLIVFGVSAIGLSLAYLLLRTA